MFGAPFPGASARAAYNGSASGIPPSVPFSFTLGFGAEDPGRIVVIALTMLAALDAGSVTIGGVTATKVASGSGSNCFAELWAALVPTGPSGTVTVNGTSTFPRVALSSYAIYGGGLAPRSSLSNTGGAIASSGVVLGAEVGINNNTTWGGVSSDFSTSLLSGSVPIFLNAASFPAQAPSSLSVSATNFAALCFAGW